MKINLLLFVMLLAITSCKNDTKSAQKVEKKAPTTQVEKSTPVVDGVKLVINSDDKMQYDKKELRAKEGKKIILTLNHTGKMAKEVMGHNWVLLKQGTNIAAFAEKALNAKANDYIPGGDEVIAHTKTLGGGESTTITFDAPAKGEYDYICSFPAHYALMKGKLIVE